MRRRGIIHSIDPVWGMNKEDIMLAQCILDTMNWKNGDRVTIDSIKMGIDTCIIIRNDGK